MKEEQKKGARGRVAPRHTHLAGAHNLVILVVEQLLPVRQPAHAARDRKQHGEEVGGEAHGLVDEPRVEVDVGVQLALDEVLVRERDALQLCGKKQSVYVGKMCTTAWRTNGWPTTAGLSPVAISMRGSWPRISNTVLATYKGTEGGGKGGIRERN